MKSNQTMSSETNNTTYNQQQELLRGELARFLTENQDMRKTAQNSLKQALYAASGAFTGSLLLGPVGGLVGGVLGSIGGYISSAKDPYDGVIVAISKIEHAKRDILLSEVKQALILAGASAQQLENSEEFGNILRRFVKTDTVRNNVWSACMQAIK